MLLGDPPPAVPVFELPGWFSVVAHFTFGATGALSGLRRGYDVIGVLFVATVTAIGGGLIRDGILISRGPASILTDSRMLWVVLLAAVVSLFFGRHIDRLGRVIAVIDALGLGAFAVYGTQRSLDAGFSQLAAVVGGTITAVGGGLLRDILVREEPLLFKPGQFYALVAIAGSALVLALLEWDALAPNAAAILTIAVMFAIRMLAIHFNWQTTSLGVDPPERSG